MTTARPAQQSTQSTRDERCAACEHSPELHDDDCRGLDMFDVKCACSTYVAFEESSQARFSVNPGDHRLHQILDERRARMMWDGTYWDLEALQPPFDPDELLYLLAGTAALARVYDAEMRLLEDLGIRVD